MEATEFHTDLKAAFGKAKIHLVNTETEKRHGAIDLVDGSILCESDEHKDILLTLVRERYVDLVGDILGDVLMEEPEPEEEPDNSTHVDFFDPGQAPGGTIREKLFQDDRVQKGLVGEQRTAGVLSVLMNEQSARILHSVDLATRDIDHVFFCERGVFVINTKYRRSPERVPYDFGREWSQKIVDDTREVAQVTSRFLADTGVALDDIYHPRVALWTEASFEVEPIELENGVSLIPGDQLVDHILGRDKVMSADTCVAMYEMLRLRQKNGLV